MSNERIAAVIAVPLLLALIVVATMLSFGVAYALRWVFLAMCQIT